jgi:flavin-binding protein dodecin
MKRCIGAKVDGGDPGRLSTHSATSGQTYKTGEGEVQFGNFGDSSLRVECLQQESNMNGSVFKILELTGTSPTSVEDAVQTAIATAAKSVRNMSWFEVAETRGAIKDGKVSEWQVTVKIGFKIEA